MTLLTYLSFIKFADRLKRVASYKQAVIGLVQCLLLVCDFDMGKKELAEFQKTDEGRRLFEGSKDEVEFSADDEIEDGKEMDGKKEEEDGVSSMAKKNQKLKKADFAVDRDKLG